LSPWSSEGKKLLGEDAVSGWDALIAEGGDFPVELVNRDAKWRDKHEKMNRHVRGSWSADPPNHWVDFTTKDKTTNDADLDDTDLSAPVAGTYMIF
jgi:hypothetical protein